MRRAVEVREKGVFPTDCFRRFGDFTRSTMDTCASLVVRLSSVLFRLGVEQSASRLTMVGGSVSGAVLFGVDSPSSVGPFSAPWSMLKKWFEQTPHRPMEYAWEQAEERIRCSSSSMHSSSSR